MKKLPGFIVILTLVLLTSPSFASRGEGRYHSSDTNDYRKMDDKWSAMSQGHWDYWHAVFADSKREKKRHASHEYDNDRHHDDADSEDDSDDDWDKFDHYGDDSDNDDYVTHKTPPVVPEPVSSLLFLTGGAALAFRRYFKKG